jgi:4-diphosphocytidyl-2-C-methyl-D-erythritol kinase
MELFANAKLNLGLNILFKREDGYHELETLMYPIPVFDKITLEPEAKRKKGQVVFSSSGLKIDGKPSDNLIVKAYGLLHKKFHLPAVRIHLEKVIPFGAGLGGGSADAAFTLKGLNQLYSLGLNNKELENYAAELGSDCAFFIKNKPALAKGRGEILEPVDIDLKAYKIVLVVPPVHISTATAYSKVSPNRGTTPLSQSLQLPIEKWQGEIKNDFEPSVFAYSKQIEQAKQQLIELGASYASLSGSGASVFGLFKDEIPAALPWGDGYFVRKF